MESSGMLASLQDTHLLHNRPTTSHTKNKYTQGNVRKRPMTAHACSSDVCPPWVNPNAPSSIPRKKFNTRLNTSSLESRVSKKAPFAPRISSSAKVWDQPKVVNGKVFNMPEYSSLEDPHLTDYYARKLGVLPKLTDKKKKRRPKVAERSASRLVYSVTMVTGDLKNAGTSARAFVQIRGTKGKISKHQLERSEKDISTMEGEKNDKNSFQFKRASSETCTIRAPDIGELISLEIEHDGIERTQSWFLEEVIVKKQSSKQMWVFPCQQWLSLYEGDCQAKRILKPLSAEETRPERVIYEVEVLTGDCRGAGTDAHVFVNLFGDRANTGRVQLVNRNIDTFERSQVDVFKIKVKYLGKLQRVLVEHDNTGFAPGWFLDKITITNTLNTKEKWYFLCNKWLSKDDGDGEISRLLLGTKSLDNVQAEHKYTIATHTGDVRGAGTDANVSITLFSKDGNTAEMKLNDSKNNFERRKVDTFKVDCPNIGNLTRVRIRHDNKGVAAGWYLEKVIVKDGDNSTFEFPCSRWLSESEDDGQISRDLVLVGNSNGFIPGLLYNLSITTGDVRGAGTSAKVYVILYSENGDTNSGKLWIRNGKSDNFERNRTDKFLVECVDQLSPVHHITVGHDNSGPGSGWYLEKVVLESPSTGIVQTFFCRQWLADDEGDKLIERDLLEDIDFRQQREAKNLWNVTVNTSNLRGAGTDANVSFVLYGDKGKSEPVQLENKTNNFESDSVDMFKVDVKDVGIPYKMRIGHDNSKMYADWHLEKVLLENSSTNERYSFECNRWIGKSEEGGNCLRELPAIGGKGDPLPVISYEVSVYTGSKRGAGTDANVFLNIFGQRGDTGERPLAKSSTNMNKFEKNEVDEFIIEAVSLSELSSIRIGHDGKNSGAGWFLDKVVVTDPTTGKGYPFLCGRWLASDEDDGQIVRELPVGDTATLLKTTSYHVRVKTGDVRGAGTDANVYIQVFGDTSDTGRLQLRQADNTKDKWERGRTDMFTLEAMDIGHVNKVIIGHDGKGMGAGWFLDSVILDVPSHGQQLKFACNRWLAEDEDDGLIERELYPSEETNIGTKIPYEIEVHTGDVRGAGTNSNVFVALYGKEKKSEEFWLRNKTDNFERAEVDKFKVECDELGPLMKLRVGHDNKGLGAAWFLDKIVVRRMKPPPKKKPRKTRNSKQSNEKKKKGHKGSREEGVEDVEDGDLGDEDEEDDCNYIFPCNRWLAKGEDDGQIVRELIPYDSTGTKARRNTLSAIIYDVHVHTADVRGSGTNSNVFLNIYGDKGDTGERELKKSETHMDKFERNQEDIFKIEAMNIGQVSKIKIRHDNSGLQSSWMLDRVQVFDTKNNVEYLFPCNRWLSKSEDDGALSRELVAVDKAEYERRRQRSLSRQQSLRGSSSVTGDNVDLEQMAEKTTFNIHVATGDVKGAGTDANVYIYMFGEKNDSGKIELKTSKTNSDKFERNQLDTFTAEAVELGDLQRIKIGHDNKGGFAGWYLDNVVIDAPSLGKKWTFQAGRWLDKGKDDGLLEVELCPSTGKQEVYEKHVPYEVVVYTSDVQGAGSDSNVFLTLYGMGGVSTEEIFLTDSKKKRKECFNRGSVDKFVREMTDIGEQIEKLRIGHDNKGFGAAWHLDKVEVRRLTATESGDSASVTHTFMCNRWLAKGEDDGAIVRELVPSKVVQEAVGKDGKMAVSEHRVDALEVHNYKIHVFTGSVKGSGTDANVFLTLYGENGDTGERPLTKSETYRDKFEKGHEDVFRMEAADLGYIRKVVVRHDNSNLGSDWYLDRIEVHDETEGRTFFFMCERWLAKKKDDGKIKRSLYEKTYEGDQNSIKSASSMSLADSRSMNSLHKSSLSTKSTSATSNSPTLTRKPSVRSMSADKVFENDVKGKMKKASSRSSLTSVMETIPYTVRVATGDKQEHETEAAVFIVLIGTDNVSEKIELDLIEKTKFAAGSVETFSVDSPDVGDIKKIELGHDGYRPKDSWYVKHIEIDVPTTGRKYFIPCDAWLGKDKEDNKTARIFSVDESKEISYKPKIPYQMTVYTGDVQNAGTDAEIKYTIFGEQGQTEDLLLEKAEERFERNSVDVIRIDVEDAGKPTKLRIGHNGKGSRPQWFLEKIVLLNLNTEEVTIFKCEQWLSKNEGEKLVRELAAEVDGKKLVSETTYTINVKTGDQRGCGTDANVFLIIFGQTGNSGELALKESLTNKDKFERGKTDVFNFTMLSLGQLTKIRIWHDNKYMRAGWFLSGVEIIDKVTQEKYTFPCERWLAKDEDDHSLMRELACSNEMTSLARKGSSDVTGYEVTFVTSDKPNAGTVNNVMLILKDGNKSSEILVQNSSKQKILNRGQTDIVKIVSKPLLALKSCVVTLQQRKGSAAKQTEDSTKWHLQELKIKDLKEDISYIFECNDWVHMSTAKESKHKVLQCSRQEKSKVATIRDSKPVQYDVKVYTADVSHAGTDANVYMTLYGENGDTGKRDLKKKFKDLFERGNMDDFKIEALDLGALTKLNIGHDNKGMGAGWMCDRIEVTNTTSNETTTFPCDQWFDKKKGDKQIVRDLFPFKL